MGHSSVRAKVRRRKVAALAAYSRQFTVHNNTIPKGDLNSKNIITMWKEIRTTKFDTPLYGKMFEIDGDGHYHLIEIDHSWKSKKYPQPKRLIKCKKRKYTGEKWTINGVGGWMRVHDTKPGRGKRNDFVSQFKNYPYTLPKMNKVEYMEKLVQHKLAKWERKNPQPAEKDDMFKEEFVTPWQIERNKAEERIRDFVVSVYDKLMLTGRFKIDKKGTATYQEEKVAEIKDVNGEGHHINMLPKDSKILKKAQKITNETKAKRTNLVCTNLRDHKKQKGRIILPQAA
jgi:hypothetical protein